MTFTKMVQWGAMATAVLCSLWFNPGTLDPFNITKLSVLVVGAAALLGLLGGFFKQWWSRSELPLLVVVSAFFVGISAAAVASNQTAYRTIWGAWARNNGWLSYVALAVVALAFALACRGSQARRGLFALIGVGTVQILYGTLQTTGNDPVAWNSGYNPIIGTVGNPNFASALLGISGVAMVWVVLEKSHDIVLRLGGGAFAVWAVWLTWRSESIQGTLAFAAGTAVLFAGWLTLEDRRPALRKLFWPYLGAGALGTVVGIWGLTGGGPLASLLFSQNLLNRTYYWRAGWRMFLQDPLFGIGLDSFGDWYRVVRLQEQVDATGVSVTSNAAHSVVFQMLGTGGLAFFGTYLILQGFAVWRGIVALRSGQNRLLVSAVFGAWTAFLLQSLFSIDQLGLTVWGWALSGLLIGVAKAPLVPPPGKRLRGRVQPASTQRASVQGLAAAGLLALGAVMLVAGPTQTDARIREVVGYAADTAQAAQVQALVGIVNETAKSAPDPYWQAQLVGKLYNLNKVDEGIAVAEAAVTMYPNDVTLWNMIALAYEQTGRAAQAVQAREQTIRLDPLNPDYRKLLAQDKRA